MKKRVLSLILAVFMLVTVFPSAAFATSVNLYDTWYHKIYETKDEMPVTNQQLLYNMLTSNIMPDKDAVIANDGTPSKTTNLVQSWKYITDGLTDYGKFLWFGDGSTFNNRWTPVYINGGSDYQEYSYKWEYINYTPNIGLSYAPSLKEAYRRAADGYANNYTNNTYYRGNGMNFVYGLMSDGGPADIPLESDCFYTYYPAGQGTNMIFLAFYDFKVKPVEGVLSQPLDGVDLSYGPNVSDLPGVTYTVGAPTQSSATTVENKNKEEMTIEKSFTYSESAETSNTSGSEVTSGWEEISSVALEFSVPLISKATVSQSMAVNHSSSQTYETSTTSSSTKAVTDTVSVTLPGHTQMAIEQTSADTTTTLSYTNAVEITYKVKRINVRTFMNNNIWECYDFEGSSAVDDLYTRCILNRNFADNKTGTEGSSFSWNNTTRDDVDDYAQTLYQHRLLATYGGNFVRKVSGTSFTPQQIKPLYPLAYITQNEGEIDLSAGASYNLRGIAVEAKNLYDVDYYGFVQRNDGIWKIDEGLSETDVLSLSTDANGNAILSGNKPGCAYVYYDPINITDKSERFRSERIKVNVKAIEVADLSHSGSIPDFILGDASDDGNFDGSGFNLTDYISIYGTDAGGNTVSLTDAKWYAQQTSGLSVNPDSGRVTVLKPGTYSVYAKKDALKSTSFSFTINEVRAPAYLSYNAPSSNLVIWKDGSGTQHPSSVDLSAYLTEVQASDQYGEPFTVDPSKLSWIPSTTNVSVSDNTVTACNVGSAVLTLRYGSAVNNITAETPVMITVKEMPRLSELTISYNRDIELMQGASDGSQSFDLSKIIVNAYDQYGNIYAINPSDYLWNAGQYGSVSSSVLTAAKSGTGAVSLTVGGVTSNAISYLVNAARRLTALEIDTDEFIELYSDTTYDLNDHISAIGYDQYGDEFDLTNSVFKWSVPNGKASVSGSLSEGNLLLTGNSAGSDTLQLKIGTVSSNTIDFTVYEGRKPVYISFNPTTDLITLWKSDGTDPLYPNTYNLNQILRDLMAIDQYGDDYTLTDYNFVSNAPSIASISGNTLTARTIGEGFITLRFGNAVSGVLAAETVKFKVMDVPRLASLEISYDSPISFISGENYNANNITVAGYDQYGDSFDISDTAYQWLCSPNFVVSQSSGSNVTLNGIVDGAGTLKLQIGTVTSNAIDVNVLPGRRLDRIEIGYDGNISFFTSPGFDLNAITINGYDQYGESYNVYESSYEWLTGGIAAVSGTKSVGDLRLCGISSGEDTLTLKIGNVVSNGISFTVNADLELTTLEISLADPIDLYSDTGADISTITVRGYDQNGAPFAVTEESFNWLTGSNAAVSGTIQSGTLMLSGISSGDDALSLQIGNVVSNTIPFTVKEAKRLATLEITCPSAIVLYYDAQDGRQSYPLSKIAVNAKDQYSNNFTINPSVMEWLTSTGKAEIDGNILCGKLTGIDTLTLRYGDIRSNALNIAVNALPYIMEFRGVAGSAPVREGVAYDLSKVSLVTKDQYGKDYTLTNEMIDSIVWSVDDTSQILNEQININGKELTVSPGVLAYGEKKNIVLTAYLPNDGEGAGITSEYVVLEVRQPSVLGSIMIQLPEGFEAKVDETILLADFTVGGYDQYGDSFDPGNVVWQSESPVIEIKNNKVLIIKTEDNPAVITAATQGITSNALEITAVGTPRLSTITLSDVPQKCDYNSTVDLTTLTTEQKDQYGNAIEIPSSVVWTMANNGSSAVITGNVLNTGNTRGTVTLTASVGPAIKSSSTIFVGTNVTAVSVSATTMSSSAGNSTISLSGDFLGHDVTIGLFMSDNSTPVLTALAQDGKAIIPVPTNQTSSAIEYEVKISYDGTAYESAPTAAITVNKKSSSGGGGGGGGSSSPIVTAKPEPTTQPEAPAESTKPSIDSFSDVSPDDWFYDAGTFVIKQGLFSGISETEFAPNDNMSRAMLVTVLFRMADQPQSGEPGFIDVPKDEWYAGAVSWASENGIVSGSGNNEFAPNREITREETAVILYKFAKSQGLDVSASGDLSAFADGNEISDWAGEAMRWAISTGLISGKENRILDPKGNATRAENAAILQRFIEHVEQKKQ